jgi:hypothetical protein
MRAPTTVLRVRNWDAFQHYKDRDPTWIKVYGRLLDDAEFLGLPEAAQAQLVKLWLLASRSKNQIRDDATFLRYALHTSKPYTELLVAHGFLERCSINSVPEPEQVSREMVQKSSPHARPRARGETETETETETTSSSAREIFLSGIPAPKRQGWHQLLIGWEAGLGTPGGKVFAPEQIDAGLAEYLANEADRTYAPRHVVRYVEQAANRPANEPAMARTGAGVSFLDLP